MKNFDNNKNQQRSKANSETDIINQNPVIFIVLEWAAIALANANFIGAIIGAIISIVAIVGGYNYSKVHVVHGRIMIVAAAITLWAQF